MKINYGNYKHKTFVVDKSTCHEYMFIVLDPGGEINGKIIDSMWMPGEIKRAHLLSSRKHFLPLIRDLRTRLFLKGRY